MLFLSLKYVAKLNDDCLFSLLIGVMSSIFPRGSGVTGAKEANKGQEKLKKKYAQDIPIYLV